MRTLLFTVLLGLLFWKPASTFVLAILLFWVVCGVIAAIHFYIGFIRDNPEYYRIPAIRENLTKPSQWDETILSVIWTLLLNLVMFAIVVVGFSLIGPQALATIKKPLVTQ